MKGMTNKRLATKPTQSQSNTMELRFTYLEDFKTKMMTYVKSNACLFWGKTKEPKG
jgi:hypothetical protein